MVPETPPHAKNMLNSHSDEIISASSSDRLIATHLICVRIGVPLLSGAGRGGAEWRFVDVELGAWAGKVGAYVVGIARAHANRLVESEISGAFLSMREYVAYNTSQVP
jgi:hypothetical protein